MSSQTSNLPDFERPPVVETVLGVEFSPLGGWDLRYYGLLWEAIREDYPEFTVQPPLSPSEQVGPDNTLARNVVVSMLGIAGPPIRAWFVDRSNTRLVQVQEDRFLHNWRKVEGHEPYPHYDQILRPAFEREWTRFLSFLEKYRIEPPTVERWEVTYVNHFERGHEWQSLDELHRLFSGWAPTPTYKFLPLAEALRLEVVYPIKEVAGHLSITVHPAVRVRDKKEVLQVNVTARGRTRSSDVGEILRCLDIGREWVVRGFTDFTSEELHNLWVRRERA